MANSRSDYIPVTDHRPIITQIVPDVPNGSLMATLSTISFPPPRIRYPLADNKQCFRTYEQKTEELARSRGLFDMEVTDERSFLLLYNSLTKILTETADECFGRNATRRRNIIKEVTSPKIEAIKAESRHIGGAILSLRTGNVVRISRQTELYMERAKRIHQRTSGNTSFDQYLKDKRRELAKDLYWERSKEAYLQAREQDTKRIKWAIQSGSTKRLLNAGISPIGLPVMVSDPDQPDQILSAPQDVKNASARYFTKLYHQETPFPTPKPWLTTPSIADVKQRVEEEPFEWPKPATVQSFRAMLRKGNPRPSPGPDGWEKWCVKTLSDQTHSLVVKLHNYMVINSVFPGNIKEVISVPIYKKGLRTNLANYRGIMLSNFLANSPMTWLNFCLT